MMRELLDFLVELSAHNNRDWFHEHKARYDVLRAGFVDDVQRLISLLAVADEELKGLQSQDCIYRIYRDIRFSPDKTPYKRFFSAYMARGGKKSPRAGYYLHVEPRNVLLCGGIWCPEPRLLKALRQAIYDNLDEWNSIVEAPVFKETYPVFDGEVLKTVPRPFPKEGAHARWMMRKDYTVVCHLPDEFLLQQEWVEAVAQKLLLLKPLNDFLNYTVDELAC